MTDLDKESLRPMVVCRPLREGLTADYVGVKNQCDDLDCYSEGE